MIATLLAACVLSAAAAPDVAARETVAAFASALANDNIEDALGQLSPDLRNKDGFAEGLRSLLRNSEVTSSISPQSNEGDGQTRTLELDWYMEVRSKSGELALTRRRETIRCTVSKSGKAKWTITSMEPASFFKHQP